MGRKGRVWWQESQAVRRHLRHSKGNLAQDANVRRNGSESQSAPAVGVRFPVLPPFVYITPRLPAVQVIQADLRCK